MKKLIWVLVALLVVVVGGVVAYFLLQPEKRYEAADLLPGNAIFFLQIPDVDQARDAYGQTPLAKIASEPSLSHLFEARSQLFANQNKKMAMVVEPLLDMLSMAQKEFFVAVTEVSIAPRFDVGLILGLDAGNRTEELRKAVTAWLLKTQGDYPDTEIKSEEFAKVPYQTLKISDNGELAVAHLGNLTLISFGRKPLLAAIGHAQKGQKDPQPALKGSPYYELAGKLHGGKIRYLFNPHAVSGLLKLAAQMGGQQAAGLEQVTAMVGSIGWGDVGFQNTLVKYVPDEQREAVMYDDLYKWERKSLKLAPKESMIYLAASFNLSRAFEYMMTKLESYNQQPATAKATAPIHGAMEFLEAGGIRLKEDLLAHLGPEVGFSFQWSQFLPTLSLTAEAKNPPALQQTLDKLTEMIRTQDPTGTMVGQGQTQGGIAYTSLQDPGVPFVQPTIALANNFLLLSLSKSGLEEALQTQDGKREGLESAESFKKISDHILPDSGMVWFIDTKPLFSQVYDLIRRSVAVMETSPLVAQNLPFDVGKLPEGEPIARHLTPFVMSVAKNEQGFQYVYASPVDLIVLLLHLIEPELLMKKTNG
jgi:hypothetical protein